MKESEIYQMAQIAVISSNCIAPENKLKILSVLIDDERLALFKERDETEKANEKG